MYFRFSSYKNYWHVIIKIHHHSQCNKALVEHGVRFHNMCWNKRCQVLHNPEVQKQCLIKETKEIMEEVRILVIAKFNKHVNAHLISE